MPRPWLRNVAARVVPSVSDVRPADTYACTTARLYVQYVPTCARNLCRTARRGRAFIAFFPACVCVCVRAGGPPACAISRRRQGGASFAWMHVSLRKLFSKIANLGLGAKRWRGARDLGGFRSFFRADWWWWLGRGFRSPRVRWFWSRARVELRWAGWRFIGGFCFGDGEGLCLERQNESMGIAGPWLVGALLYDAFAKAGPFVLIGLPVSLRLFNVAFVSSEGSWRWCFK
ncbi:hypothetical protein K505DRAFT_158635 [Melanomma pulvis-pyrius CBS 109.77]|uniref:Uncharacterized protein n=1 Tax=Melanomma pulvis-pyrius CBS 109.77 TaxID=1314802 RepID=A0A6A6XL47_9PLEO|nr:hypothetical protein K505DRAFT_158635 [Melanomma pulvis-pyrius CBS 109.77]